jgi:hypothetical protein
MEHSPKEHEEVLAWIKHEFRDILGNSEQAIYIYICDTHKLCNHKFSSMLGYASPDVWAMKEEMLSDAREEDQEVIISAYKDAMENKVGSAINVFWKNHKTGKSVETKVIIVPSSYKGQLFAVHFISVI